MARRYYCNLDHAPGETILEGPEFHHLAHVLRLKDGDSLVLFDGKGKEAPATILNLGKRQALVQVEAPLLRPGVLPFSLTVATPLPKGDREMFLVEKITELGVTRLIPLETRRSVVHPKDCATRLHRYSLEACKQSGRNTFLEVDELTPLAQFLTHCTEEHRRILDLNPSRGGFGISNLAPSSVALLIGPEGGFTEDERTAASGAGFQTWTLPGNVLRMETAAIAASAILNHLYGNGRTDSSTPRPFA